MEDSMGYFMEHGLGCLNLTEPGANDDALLFKATVAPNIWGCYVLELNRVGRELPAGGKEILIGGHVPLQIMNELWERFTLCL